MSDPTPKVISGSDQAASEAVPQAQRTPSAGQAPPSAARPPQAPAQPGDQLAERQAASQPERGEDLSARAAELEAELAQVRSKAAGAATVRLKVEEPHAGIVHNGLWVGTDWTEVPAHVVPDLMEGAANSGVTVTQEETES